MELKCKIDEINYGDAAIVAKSVLAKLFADRTDAVAMAANTAAGLSPKLIRVLLAEITDERMSQLISAFAAEYKPKIISAVNDLSDEKKLGVEIADFAVTPDLEIWAKVAEIDYPCAVERFLPVIKEKLLNMGGPAVLLRPVIQSASASQICGLMDKLLGGKKEAFIVGLINQNAGKLVSAVEKKAAQKKIRLKISQFRAAE